MFRFVGSNSFRMTTLLVVFSVTYYLELLGVASLYSLEISTFIDGFPLQLQKRVCGCYSITFLNQSLIGFGLTRMKE